MPRYDFECPKCGVFEATACVDGPFPRCKCGRKAKKLISAPSRIVALDGFEENNRKALSQDLLHEARMENKRAVERDWHKVESGEAVYNPDAKVPDAYKPWQQVEREKKRLY